MKQHSKILGNEGGGVLQKRNRQCKAELFMGTLEQCPLPIPRPQHLGMCFRLSGLRMKVVDVDGCGQPEHLGAALPQLSGGRPHR